MLTVLREKLLSCSLMSLCILLRCTPGFGAGEDLVLLIACPATFPVALHTEQQLTQGLQIGLDNGLLFTALWQSIACLLLAPWYGIDCLLQPLPVSSKQELLQAQACPCHPSQNTLPMCQQCSE